MGLSIYLRRVVPRFSRGAPASAFLGSHYDTVYPMFAGYGQTRQFRPTTPSTPLYSLLTTTQLPSGIAPSTGRFAVSARSTRTSPLIGNTQNEDT